MSEFDEQRDSADIEAYRLAVRQLLEQISKRDDRLKWLQAEQERLHQELAEKDKAIEDLSAQLREREEVLIRLLSSKSWKLTAPLRWSYTKFRMLLRDLLNLKMVRSQQRQAPPNRDSLGGLLLIVGTFKMAISHPRQVPKWIHKACILLKREGGRGLIRALKQFLSVQSQITYVQSGRLKNQRQPYEISFDSHYKNIYLTLLDIAQKGRVQNMWSFPTLIFQKKICRSS